MQFFEIHHDKNHDRLVEWNHKNPGRKLFRIPCTIHGKFGGGGYWDGPLRIILDSPNISDFVWTNASECLIQDHVLKTFIEEGLTGFVVKALGDISYKKKKKLKPVKLHELVVTGWAGDAPMEAGAGLREYCPLCQRSLFSNIIDFKRLINVNQWDSSDFFMVWPLSRYIFVTEKVVELIKRKGFSGCKYTPIEKIKPTNTGLSPGLPPKGKTHQRYLYDDKGHITNWEEILEPPPEPISFEEFLRQQEEEEDA